MPQPPEHDCFQHPKSQEGLESRSPSRIPRNYPKVGCSFFFVFFWGGGLYFLDPQKGLRVQRPRELRSWDLSCLIRIRGLGLRVYDEIEIGIIMGYTGVI